MRKSLDYHIIKPREPETYDNAVIITSRNSFQKKRRFIVIDRAIDVSAVILK